MFTGIIKLAQIDDYITPSQKCTQPKILTQDPSKQKGSITLNDCLACSGCITSAETILIQQMGVDKFIEFSKGQEEIYVVMAQQSVLALARYYQIECDVFFRKFGMFMQRQFKNVRNVFDLGLATQICHQLIYQQYRQRSTSKKYPIICSQCPGWVCYAQKTLSTNITQLMSEIKSPQQLSSQIIKSKYGKNNRIVSVMPCYDKKLESIRFQGEGGKEIDLTLTTGEIVELVRRINGDEKFGEDGESVESGIMQIDNITFVKDQTSNGYIESLLSRLHIKQYKCEQVKNSDFTQYTFQLDGIPSKMAKCYGFRNIQKIVQLIKKNKCSYLYIQIMACPGGCFGGGGQIRYDGVKNKEIILEFEEMVKRYGGKEEEGRVELGGWDKLGVKKERALVKYRPIEKKMSQVVMNW